MLILGPCGIEDEASFKEHVEKIYTTVNRCNEEEWYFKTSFDKANRTSLYGSRGIGLEKAIELFRWAKTEYPDIKLTTDVHECWQVEKLVDVIDVIQIPAFLCRQTDLVVECARLFPIVNIKKGQWIGPNNLIKSVDKIRSTNPDCKAWVTNRGSNFGYDILLLDNTIVDELKIYYDAVILDATHSVQRSRAVYLVQGDRKLAERYFISSPLFGYDGTFAEVHVNPLSAVSDGDCQICMKDLDTIIRKRAACQLIAY